MCVRVLERVCVCLFVCLFFFSASDVSIYIPHEKKDEYLLFAQGNRAGS